MVRLGLCCAFRDVPIKFMNTTATSAAKLNRKTALTKLSTLCLANARALRTALVSDIMGATTNYYACWCNAKFWNK